MVVAAILIFVVGANFFSPKLYDELVDWQGGLGAVVGLFGLAWAALLNAQLNREHADRIRNQELVSRAIAIHAELEGIELSLITVNRQAPGWLTKAPSDFCNGTNFANFRALVRHLSNIEETFIERETIYLGEFGYEIANNSRNVYFYIRRLRTNADEILNNEKFDLEEFQTVKLSTIEIILEVCRGLVDYVPELRVIVEQFIAERHQHLNVPETIASSIPPAISKKAALSINPEDMLSTVKVRPWNL